MIKINIPIFQSILILTIAVLVTANFALDYSSESTRYEIDNNLIILGSNLVETDKKIAGQFDGLLRIVEIQEMQILDLQSQVDNLRNP